MLCIVYTSLISADGTFLTYQYENIIDNDTVILSFIVIVVSFYLINALTLAYIN